MSNHLYLVGMGIKFMSHLTIETKSCIEQADKVLYLVNEPAMQEWIKKTNSHAESLDHLYNTNYARMINYENIANHICHALEKTQKLCFVTYGHPTFLAQPTILAMEKAKAQGHQIYIMPGISSEDCLYADLMIDPSSCGVQSFEATNFLIYTKVFDPSCHLILFQASMIGIKENFKNQSCAGLKILTDYLLKQYSEDHVIFIYEAAQYPSLDAQIEKIPLKELPHARLSSLSTLYIPPSVKKTPNLFYVNQLNELT